MCKMRWLVYSVNAARSPTEHALLWKQIFLVGYRFLILWFSIHCEQLWNPYRSLFSIVLALTHPYKLLKAQEKTMIIFHSFNFPISTFSDISSDVFPRQKWCVDRSIVILGDDACVWFTIEVKRYDGTKRFSFQTFRKNWRMAVCILYEQIEHIWFPISVIQLGALML